MVKGKKRKIQRKAHCLYFGVDFVEKRATTDKASVLWFCHIESERPLNNEKSENNTIFFFFFFFWGGGGGNLCFGHLMRILFLL